MWTKNMAERLVVFIFAGILLATSGCQAPRGGSPAGGFDAKDDTHPRHVTGIESHVGDY